MSYAVDGLTNGRHVTGHATGSVRLNSHDSSNAVLCVCLQGRLNGGNIDALAVLMGRADHRQA